MAFAGRNLPGQPRVGNAKPSTQNPARRQSKATTQPSPCGRRRGRRRFGFGVAGRGCPCVATWNPGWLSHDAVGSVTRGRRSVLLIGRANPRASVRFSRPSLCGAGFKRLPGSLSHSHFGFASSDFGFLEASAPGHLGRKAPIPDPGQWQIGDLKSKMRIAAGAAPAAVSPADPPA